MRRKGAKEATPVVVGSPYLYSTIQEVSGKPPASGASTRIENITVKQLEPEPADALLVSDASVRSGASTSAIVNSPSTQSLGMNGAQAEELSAQVDMGASNSNVVLSDQVDDHLTHTIRALSSRSTSSSSPLGVEDVQMVLRLFAESKHQANSSKIKEIVLSLPVVESMYTIHRGEIPGGTVHVAVKTAIRMFLLFVSHGEHNPTLLKSALAILQESMDELPPTVFESSSGSGRQAGALMAPVREFLTQLTSSRPAENSENAVVAADGSDAIRNTALNILLRYQLMSGSFEAILGLISSSLSCHFNRYPPPDSTGIRETLSRRLAEAVSDAAARNIQNEENDSDASALRLGSWGGELELKMTSGRATLKKEGKTYVIRDAGNFDSFEAPGTRIHQGKYYYEVKLEVGRIEQIGWAINGFSPSDRSGIGVGDDNYSWGYCFNRRSLWAKKRESYMDQISFNLSRGDIVGTGIDMKKRTIQYFWKGQLVAFHNFSSAAAKKGIFPAFTVKEDCTAFFAKRDLTYLPSGYSPLVSSFMSNRHSLPRINSDMASGALLLTHEDVRSKFEPSLPEQIDALSLATMVASYVDQLSGMYMCPLKFMARSHYMSFVESGQPIRAVETGLSVYLAPSTFSGLSSIISQCFEEISKRSEIRFVYILLAMLRVLHTHLFQLCGAVCSGSLQLEDILHPETSLTLHDLLRRICDFDTATLPLDDTSDTENVLIVGNAIKREAFHCFATGLDAFVPVFSDQLNLAAGYFEKKAESGLGFTSSPVSSSSSSAPSLFEQWSLELFLYRLAQPDDLVVLFWQATYLHDTGDTTVIPAMLRFMKSLLGVIEKVPFSVSEASKERFLLQSLQVNITVEVNNFVKKGEIKAKKKEEANEDHPKEEDDSNTAEGWVIKRRLYNRMRHPSTQQQEPLVEQTDKEAAASNFYCVLLASYLDSLMDRAIVQSRKLFQKLHSNKSDGVVAEVHTALSETLLGGLLHPLLVTMTTLFRSSNPRALAFADACDGISKMSELVSLVASLKKLLPDHEITVPMEWSVQGNMFPWPKTVTDLTTFEKDTQNTHTCVWSHPGGSVTLVYFPDGKERVANASGNEDEEKNNSNSESETTEDLNEVVSGVTWKASVLVNGEECDVVDSLVTNKADPDASNTDADPTPTSEVMQEEDEKEREVKEDVASAEDADSDETATVDPLRYGVPIQAWVSMGRLSSTFSHNISIQFESRVPSPSKALEVISTGLTMAYTEHCLLLMRGDVPSEQEEASAMWLDSSLFSGGLEDHAYKFSIFPEKPSTSPLVPHSPISSTSSSRFPSEEESPMITSFSPVKFDSSDMPPRMTSLDSNTSTTYSLFGELKRAWQPGDDVALLEGLFEPDTARVARTAMSSVVDRLTVDESSSDAMWLVWSCELAAPDNKPVQRSVAVRARQCVLYFFAALLKHTMTLKQAVLLARGTRALSSTTASADKQDIHAADHLDGLRSNVVRHWRAALRVKSMVASSVAQGDSLDKISLCIRNRCSFLLGLIAPDKVHGIGVEEVHEMREMLHLPSSPFLNRQTSNYVDPEAVSVDNSFGADLNGLSPVLFKEKSRGEQLWSSAKSKTKLLSNALQATSRLRGLILERDIRLMESGDPMALLSNSLLDFAMPGSKWCPRMSEVEEAELVDDVIEHGKEATSNAVDEKKSSNRTTAAASSSSNTEEQKDEETKESDEGEKKMERLTLDELRSFLEVRRERADKRLKGVSRLSRLASTLSDSLHMEVVLASMNACYSGRATLETVSNKNLVPIQLSAPSLDFTPIIVQDHEEILKTELKGDIISVAARPVPDEEQEEEDEKKVESGTCSSEQETDTNTTDGGTASTDNTNAEAESETVSEAPVIPKKYAGYVNFSMKKTCSISLRVISMGDAVDEFEEMRVSVEGHFDFNFNRGQVKENSQAGRGVCHPAVAGFVLHAVKSEDSLYLIVNDSRVYEHKYGSDVKNIRLWLPPMSSVQVSMVGHDLYLRSEYDATNEVRAKVVRSRHILDSMNNMGMKVRRPLSKMYARILEAATNLTDISDQLWLHVLNLCNKEFQRTDRAYFGRLDIIRQILPLIDIQRCLRLSKAQTEKQMALVNLREKQGVSVDGEVEKSEDGNDTSSSNNDNTSESKTEESKEEKEAKEAEEKKAVDFETEEALIEEELVQLRRQWGVKLTAWGVFRRLAYDACSGHTDTPSSFGEYTFKSLPPPTNEAVRLRQRLIDNLREQISTATDLLDKHRKAVDERKQKRDGDDASSTSSLRSGVSDGLPIHLSDVSIGWSTLFISEDGTRKGYKPILGADEAEILSSHERVETYAFLNQLLWVVLRMCRAPVVREHILSEPKWIQNLLDVLYTAWPSDPSVSSSTSDVTQTTRLLVSRVLRSLLPVSSTSLKMKKGFLNDEPAKKQFVEFILKKIADSSSFVVALSCVLGKGSKDEPTSAVDLATATELTYLIRSLVATPHWTLVETHLRDAFSRLEGLSDFLVETGKGSAFEKNFGTFQLSAFRSAMAALYVVGGLKLDPVKHVYEGMRVEVDSDILEAERKKRKEKKSKNKSDDNEDTGDDILSFVRSGVIVKVHHSFPTFHGWINNPVKQILFESPVGDEKEKKEEKNETAGVSIPSSSTSVNDKDKPASSEKNGDGDEKEEEVKEVEVKETSCDLEEVEMGGSQQTYEEGKEQISRDKEKEFSMPSFFSESADHISVVTDSAEKVLVRFDDGSQSWFDRKHTKTIPDVAPPVEHLSDPISLLSCLWQLLRINRLEDLPSTHPLNFDSEKVKTGVFPVTSDHAATTQLESRAYWFLADLHLRRVASSTLEAFLENETVSDVLCDAVFKSSSSKNSPSTTSLFGGDDLALFRTIKELAMKPLRIGATFDQQISTESHMLETLSAFDTSLLRMIERQRPSVERALLCGMEPTLPGETELIKFDSNGKKKITVASSGGVLSAPKSATGETTWGYEFKSKSFEDKRGTTFMSNSITIEEKFQGTTFEELRWADTKHMFNLKESERAVNQTTNEDPVPIPFPCSAFLDWSNAEHFFVASLPEHVGISEAIAPSPEETKNVTSGGLLSKVKSFPDLKFGESNVFSPKPDGESSPSLAEVAANATNSSRLVLGGSSSSTSTGGSSFSFGSSTTTSAAPFGTTSNNSASPTTNSSSGFTFSNAHTSTSSANVFGSASDGFSSSSRKVSSSPFGTSSSPFRTSLNSKATEGDTEGLESNPVFGFGGPTPSFGGFGTSNKEENASKTAEIKEEEVKKDAAAASPTETKTVDEVKTVKDPEKSKDESTETKETETKETETKEKEESIDVPIKFHEQRGSFIASETCTLTPMDSDGTKESGWMKVTVPFPKTFDISPAVVAGARLVFPASDDYTESSSDALSQSPCTLVATIHDISKDGFVVHVLRTDAGDLHGDDDDDGDDRGEKEDTKSEEKKDEEVNKSDSTPKFTFKPQGDVTTSLTDKEAKKKTLLAEINAKVVVDWIAATGSHIGKMGASRHTDRSTTAVGRSTFHLNTCTLVTCPSSKVAEVWSDSFVSNMEEMVSISEADNEKEDDLSKGTKRDTTPVSSSSRTTTATKSSSALFQSSTFSFGAPSTASPPAAAAISFSGGVAKNDKGGQSEKTGDAVEDASYPSLDLKGTDVVGLLCGSAVIDFDDNHFQRPPIVLCTGRVVGLKPDDPPISVAVNVGSVSNTSFTILATRVDSKKPIPHRTRVYFEWYAYEPVLLNTIPHINQNASSLLSDPSTLSLVSKPTESKLDTVAPVKGGGKSAKMMTGTTRFRFKHWSVPKKKASFPSMPKQTGRSSTKILVKGGRSRLRSRRFGGSSGTSSTFGSSPASTSVASPEKAPGNLASFSFGASTSDKTKSAGIQDKHLPCIAVPFRTVFIRFPHKVGGDLPPTVMVCVDSDYNFHTQVLSVTPNGFWVRISVVSVDMFGSLSGIKHAALDWVVWSSEWDSSSYGKDLGDAVRARDERLVNRLSLHNFSGGRQSLFNHCLISPHQARLEGVEDPLKYQKDALGQALKFDGKISLKADFVPPSRFRTLDSRDSRSFTVSMEVKPDESDEKESAKSFTVVDVTSAPGVGTGKKYGYTVRVVAGDEKAEKELVVELFDGKACWSQSFSLGNKTTESNIVVVEEAPSDVAATDDDDSGAKRMCNDETDGEADPSSSPTSSPKSKTAAAEEAKAASQLFTSAKTTFTVACQDSVPETIELSRLTPVKVDHVPFLNVIVNNWHACSVYSSTIRQTNPDFDLKAALHCGPLDPEADKDRPKIECGAGLVGFISKVKMWNMAVNVSVDQLKKFDQRIRSHELGSLSTFMVPSPEQTKSYLVSEMGEENASQLTDLDVLRVNSSDITPDPDMEEEAVKLRPIPQEERTSSGYNIQQGLGAIELRGSSFLQRPVPDNTPVDSAVVFGSFQLDGQPLLGDRPIPVGHGAKLKPIVVLPSGLSVCIDMCGFTYFVSGDQAIALKLPQLAYNEWVRFMVGPSKDVPISNNNFAPRTYDVVFRWGDTLYETTVSGPTANSKKQVLVGGKPISITEVVEVFKKKTQSKSKNEAKEMKFSSQSASTGKFTFGGQPPMETNSFSFENNQSDGWGSSSFSAGPGFGTPSSVDSFGSGVSGNNSFGSQGSQGWGASDTATLSSTTTTESKEQPPDEPPNLLKSKTTPSSSSTGAPTLPKHGSGSSSIMPSATPSVDDLRMVEQGDFSRSCLVLRDIFIGTAKDNLKERLDYSNLVWAYQRDTFIQVADTHVKAWGNNIDIPLEAVPMNDFAFVGGAAYVVDWILQTSQLSKKWSKEHIDMISYSEAMGVNATDAVLRLIANQVRDENSEVNNNSTLPSPSPLLLRNHSGASGVSTAASHQSFAAGSASIQWPRHIESFLVDCKHYYDGSVTIPSASSLRTKRPSAAPVLDSSGETMRLYEKPLDDGSLLEDEAAPTDTILLKPCTAPFRMFCPNTNSSPFATMNDRLCALGVNDPRMAVYFGFERALIVAAARRSLSTFISRRAEMEAAKPIAGLSTSLSAVSDLSKKENGDVDAVDHVDRLLQILDIRSPVMFSDFFKTLEEVPLIEKKAELERYARAHASFLPQVLTSEASRLAEEFPNMSLNGTTLRDIADVAPFTRYVALNLTHSLAKLVKECGKHLCLQISGKNTGGVPFVGEASKPSLSECVTLVRAVVEFMRRTQPRGLTTVVDREARRDHLHLLIPNAARHMLVVLYGFTPISLSQHLVSATKALVEYGLELSPYHVRLLEAIVPPPQYGMGMPKLDSDLSYSADTALTELVVLIRRTSWWKKREMSKESTAALDARAAEAIHCRPTELWERVLDAALAGKCEFLDDSNSSSSTASFGLKKSSSTSKLSEKAVSDRVAVRAEITKALPVLSSAKKLSDIAKKEFSMVDRIALGQELCRVFSHEHTSPFAQNRGEGRSRSKRISSLSPSEKKKANGHDGSLPRQDSLAPQAAAATDERNVSVDADVAEVSNIAFLRQMSKDSAWKPITSTANAEVTVSYSRSRMIPLRVAMEVACTEQGLDLIGNDRPEIPITDSKKIMEAVLNFYEENYIFTVEADLQLVQLIDKVCKGSAISITAKDWTPDQKERDHFDLLKHLPLRVIRTRFRVLLKLNHMIFSHLRYCDLSNTRVSFVDPFHPARESSAIAHYSRSRDFIFRSAKKEFLEHWSKPGRRGGYSVGPYIYLNVPQMAVAMKKKAIKSYLEQCARQLNGTNFRVTEGSQAFTVSYVNMAGIDQGGPYRDVISRMCNEIMSNDLPLFVPCPNAREKVGHNQHTVVPTSAPLSDSDRHLYAFVGALMGLAIRSQDLLNIEFPSIVWKQLVYDEVTIEDVLAVDVLAFRIVDLIRSLEADPHMTPALFNEQMATHRFTAIGSDGARYAIVEGGEQIPIRWDNRNTFIESLVKYRLHEYEAACSAMRSGLATVVCVRSLTFHTWRQIQDCVCGSPVIDVARLKLNTRYTGSYHAEHRVIKDLWEVLENRLNNDELCRYLEFVWGRSRLPRGDNWSMKMCIHEFYSSNPDKYLPVTHTCGFSIELPCYSTVEIMHEKLLFAITHCIEMANA